MNPDFLEAHFLGNPLREYLWCVGILVAGMVLKRLFSTLSSKLIFILIKKYGEGVGMQKFVRLMARPIEFLALLVIVYLAFNRLVFPEEWKLAPKEEFGFRLFLSKAYKVLLFVSIAWIVLRLVDFIALVMMDRSKKTDTLSDDQVVLFTKEAVKFMLAGISFFILIGYIFHLDIVGVITGLGIGGLGIALAAKETIENLLGSFTIFFDKPFVAGDTVRVGSIEGKVENVGFRSTRIRALDKMIVTIPNKKMIEAELINETDRLVRRSATKISLVYETSEERLRRILAEIRRTIKDHPLTENDTDVVRFRTFSATGLEVMVNYIVLTSDLNEFLNVQEEINFQIMEIVRRNGSAFASQGQVSVQNLPESGTNPVNTTSAGEVLK